MEPEVSHTTAIPGRGAVQRGSTTSPETEARRDGRR